MALLSFFNTGQGVFFLGVLAALAVVLWDWRVSLGVLFVIQVGVAALAVGIEGVPGQMMLVQTLVIGLVCIMLAMSGMQVHMRRSGRQSGGWFFRLLVLGLLAAALWSLELTIVLPEISLAIVRIFAWLGLIALLMLSLGDNPLFTSVALLLWCVLGQAVAAVYTPAPEILVVIGLIELALGLTFSYLILAERLPRLWRAEWEMEAMLSEVELLSEQTTFAPQARPNPLLRHGPSTQPAAGSPMETPAEPPRGGGSQ